MSDILPARNFGQTVGGQRIDLLTGAPQSPSMTNGRSYAIGDDGQGNFNLTFSGGGSVTLQGLAPATPVNQSWFS